MAIAVWANGPDVHGVVCADASLGGVGGGSAYAGGETDGQSGWDVGLNFVSLHEGRLGKSSRTRIFDIGVTAVMRLI
jgi:hypothetical protein